MKKLFVVCSLVVALFGVMAFNAGASMITGALSLSGTSVQNNLDLIVATAFTSFSNVVVSGTGGNGDYAPALSGQSVTFTPFTFRPSLSPDPVVPLWTFAVGGKTYSFDATSLTISGSTFNTISMSGTGIAHITGFTDTPGNWYFSANGSQGTASFSASTQTSPVPLPAAMLLFGPGLAGLAAMRRRLKK